MSKYYQKGVYGQYLWLMVELCQISSLVSWALSGIAMAWNKGAKKVYVEADSSIAIKLCNFDCKEDCPSTKKKKEDCPYLVLLKGSMIRRGEIWNYFKTP